MPDGKNVDRLEWARKMLARTREMTPGDREARKELLKAQARLIEQRRGKS